MFELFVTLFTFAVMGFFIWLGAVAIKKAVQQSKTRKYLKDQSVRK